MDTTSSQLVSGLWVGDRLPLMAQLCIKTYLDHGIGFQLFTYKDYANIPDGTRIRDARDILPEEAIFRHDNGSLAPFADWFRNEFLVQEGGFWTDLDVACLRDTLPEADIWFCTQEPGLVAVGVIAFPPRHPLMEDLRRIAEDPATTVPWDRPEETRAKQELLRIYPTAEERRRKAPWGHCGPEGFTRALRHYGLMGQAAPPSRLYPLHYTVWRKCYNGDCHLQSPELANAWAIHLWGEMLRREPDAWDNLARNSIIGQLLVKHLPAPDAPASPAEKKKVRILVGICSCTAAAQRRKACRETWMQRPQEGIDCLFFLGKRGSVAGEPDVVALWVDDSYSHLPAKGLAFYQWALENYDFDWLFKCDDDTYLALDRLESLCDGNYDLIGDVSLAQRGCPSGGAGYLMSRPLVEKIVAHRAEVPATGAEDIIFGNLARKLGARTLATPRLCLSPHPAPHPRNQQVSCHWCPPALMRDIDNLFHAKPFAVMQARHPYWEDSLLFFRNGRFLRPSSGCTGTFLLQGEEAVILRWDKWPEETLTREGGIYRQGSFTLSPLPGEPAFFDSLTPNPLTQP